MALTGGREAMGSTSATVTLDQAASSSSSSAQVQQPSPQQVLTLRLAPRRKKKVTWKEGTVDNEFMNRKSSKKCCIFHKEKPFDEDDSEDENGREGKEDRGVSNGHHCSHQH